MLNKYKGCLLGAVLGDALGMPGETTVSRFIGVTRGFKRAHKGHPNHDLLPGQYTDDSQLMLAASRLLADASWDPKAYAKDLLRTYSLNKFRYPDGTIYAACKRMQTTNDLTASGVYSDTAGCLSLAVPFALAYKDRKEMAPKLLEACSITHTHPGAHAAAIALALMLNTLIETGSADDAYQALITAAQNMDPDLAARISNAVRIEKSGMHITDSLAAIGNSSSVYHTLPLAVFLCNRFMDPEELLICASSCGGNADTLTLVCGAYIGAYRGVELLPQDLLAQLERRGEFETLAEKLLNPQKPNPKKSEPKKSDEELVNEPESIYDSGWEPE